MKNKRFLHITIALILVLAGLAGFAAMANSKPQLEKKKLASPAPLVQVMPVASAEHQVLVSGQGTVRALREVRLVAKVGGELMYVDPALVNGGSFKQGQVLMRIDQADYEVAVVKAQSQVKDAESKLLLAKAERDAATEDWLEHQRLQEGPDLDVPPLVAKEPQLLAANANLDASKADLRKARLDLSRTVIKAPFSGLVQGESVDRGQNVNAGQELATIYSIEAAEIVVPLSSSELNWIKVPGFTAPNGPGSPVNVNVQIAGKRQTWQGRVVRAEGAIDERTRMIKVVVRVDKPYLQLPPLAMGLFVNVQVQGRNLSSAVKIPAGALRSPDQVWVVDGKSRLRLRGVTTSRREKEYVLLATGLKEGDMLVTSSLGAVSDGMNVRVADRAETSQ